MEFASQNSQPHPLEDTAPLSLYLSFKTQLAELLQQGKTEEALQLSIALINSNFSEKDQSILVRAQEQKSLFQLIGLASDFEIKTNILIFLNDQIDKQKATSLLTVEDICFYFKLIQ